MLFPTRPGARTTTIELVQDDEGFPVVLATDAGGAPSGLPLLPNGPGMPLLGEQSRGLLVRPHLRGHRPDPGVDDTAWSTRFTCATITPEGDRLGIELTDPTAGLDLLMECESLVGGGLRARHTLTNTATTRYQLDGLEVVLPVADHLVELLDFTGRHERERSPQRHTVTDGLWLREARGGRPGLGSATMLVLGTPGFTTTSGEVAGVHVAWSGNSVLRVERGPETGTTIGGGELLLPGEVVLDGGESYATPWVHLAHAPDGLDGLAASWHAHQRSLAAHPGVQPVLLNVWEAVYFDHDLDRLQAIAERAARVGVERFVLDDGWFLSRRDDTAGLGDWAVDETVWPDGLTPLVERVHALGMEFGLWVEPEMVNPDSALYREHPDWILAAGGRVPLQHRNQLVLDLGRPEVFEHVRSSISAVLDTYPVDFVKWDHNRELLEAGSADRAGAPGAHRQANAFYALLDALRAEHPGISWESCASGGGRIDLGVLERVQRVWASDMTDALARQQIQRWTMQLLAPEYVGAHVSSPRSHTTHRTLDLDFRAGTALFGAFGIEWDLTDASEDDLDRLADWVARHKRFRPLLHSGRTVRPGVGDPAAQVHGVIASDGSEALLALAQLDEPAHNRGSWVRVPGLDAAASYDLRWEGPADPAWVSMSAPLAQDGPTKGVAVTGAQLAARGYWVPRRRPQTITLVHLTRR